MYKFSRTVLSKHQAFPSGNLWRTYSWPSWFSIYLLIYRTECYDFLYQIQFIHAHIPYFFTYFSTIRHLISGTKLDNNIPKLGQCQHSPPWAITTDSLWHQAGVSINNSAPRANITFFSFGTWAHFVNIFFLGGILTVFVLWQTNGDKILPFYIASNQSLFRLINTTP